MCGLVFKSKIKDQISKLAQDPRDKWGFLMDKINMTAERITEKAVLKNRLGNNPFEQEVLFAHRWATIGKSGADYFFVSGGLFAQIVDYLGREEVKRMSSVDPEELIALGVYKVLENKGLEGVLVSVDLFGGESQYKQVYYQVSLSRNVSNRTELTSL